MAKKNSKSSSVRSLKNMYHPDAVAYMLEKAGGNPITHEQAEQYDQAWAAERLSTTKNQASTEDISNMMQETPNNAPVRGAVRSPQFKKVLENRNNGVRAVAESNQDLHTGIINLRIPGTGNSHV
jgi:hypothetical protein